MRTPAFALIVATGVFASSLAIAAQSSGIKSVASTLDIMNAMTVPLSDAVFRAASQPPVDDKAWGILREQAAALAEAGNLLMIGDRIKDSGEWMALSRAQVDAAEVAARAAAARNADQLSTAADNLYETCANCHEKYLPK